MLSLFLGLLLLISTAPSRSAASIPEIDLNITSNGSLNNYNIPHIDLNIKKDSKIPDIDIPIQQAIPEINLNIKENSTIPHIDLNIKEDSKIPHIDISIKENSTIPNIDIPIKQTIPEVDIDIKSESNKTFTAPHIDLKIEAKKIPEIDPEIKKTTIVIANDDDDTTTDPDTEDSDNEENKKGVCDITLITPVGQMYEKLVEANNKSKKFQADDASGILYLVVNTHTCLCKISGTALQKENRSEKPFLKVKPTEKELRTTYKFPFPVRSASFKCTDTA